MRGAHGRLVSENVKRSLRIAGHIIPMWLVGIIVISAFVPAMLGNSSVATDLASLNAGNTSVLVSANAASFLNYTYNSTLGLCSEVYGNSGNSLGFPGQVFWIITDNLLAYYALQPYDKTVSDNIKYQIEAYAKKYSLPTDLNGLPISFKHEPILGDKLPAGTPHGYNLYNLTQKDSYLVATEVDNGSVWPDWMNYSDELAWMGMSFLNGGDATDAMVCYNNMMSMWDGFGFADAAHNNTNAIQYGYYEPFKLALAIILRQRLKLPKPPQETTMENILAACQGPDGGIATGYDKNLSTAGHTENTETTALVVVANVSLSRHNDVRVGFYYYVWYGEGFGGRHWNDSDVAPVVDEPILGYYNSQNTSTIRQHLNWFKELNISFLIISWWGPNSYEDNATKTIFSMVKQYNYPIEIAIMVEAYNWSGIYDFKAIFDYINDTYVVPYGSIYMKLYDLPFVCFFNDNINMTRTEANRTAIRSVPGFSARIVGHTEDYVDWWAWPIAGYEEAPKPRLSRDGFIGILPRYDDTHLPNRTNTMYDVNYTEGLYDEQWNETLRMIEENTVNFVAIYSWNEYHERSQVEPHISPDGTYVLSPFSKTYHYIQAIPEFPSLLVPTLLVIATLLAVIVLKRKQTIRTKPTRTLNRERDDVG